MRIALENRRRDEARVAATPAPTLGQAHAVGLARAQALTVAVAPLVDPPDNEADK